MYGCSGVAPGELVRFPRGVPPVECDLPVLSTLMLSSGGVVACVPGSGVPSLLRCGAKVYFLVLIILPCPPSGNGSGSLKETFFRTCVSFAVFQLSLVVWRVGGFWVCRLPFFGADPFPVPILI